MKGWIKVYSKKVSISKVFLVALSTSLLTGMILFFSFLYLFTPANLPKTGGYQKLDISKSTQPYGINFENYSANIPVTIAKTSTLAVVGISALKPEGESVFERNPAEKWGIGSGVIVNQNGYILTNFHVAGKSKKIVISTADRGNFEGQTLWSDPILDLAIVKINVTNLPVIPIGDSSILQVGEPAIAIGNPLGLELQRTVTSGIISALDRTIRIDTDQGTNFMEDLIQTDASINPGNSGGPLLNSKGQVIGINTVKVASAEGIGFAVPANIVRPVIQSFISKGSFKEPYMGVFAYNKDIVKNFDENIKLDKGILISNIDETGPAYISGLRLGDVITSIDGSSIKCMIQLRAIIYSKNAGDEINVSAMRNNSAMNLKIKLANKDKYGLITR